MMSLSKTNPYESPDSKAVFTKRTPPADKTPEPSDPTEVFWRLAGLCYQLFIELGKLGQFLNDKLTKINVDLTARNSAMGLVVDSGPVPGTDNDTPKPGSKFPFGGPAGNPAALKRANDLIDYLHSFGLATDFPPGYANDPTVKVTENDRTTNVTVSMFNNWKDLLSNQIDQLKNESQVESTKAEGTLKSSSAAIDLMTSLVKNTNGMGQSVVTNFKM